MQFGKFVLQKIKIKETGIKITTKNLKEIKDDMAFME